MDHGNSNNNDNSHHLYEIWDKKLDDVYKYGISDEPIEVEDGLSSRARNQVYQMNLPENWLRYIGRVLIKDIANRILAKVLEDECVNAYIEKHGKRPRGNPPRRKSRFEQTLPDEENEIG
mgnify:CR=1 FL=1